MYRQIIGRRSVSTLLVIDHQAGKPLGTNAHALTAANKLGFPITALVAGTDAHAEQAAKIVAGYPGVTKVLIGKGSQYDHSLAEPHAELIASQAKQFSHVLTSHSVYGKNVFPRAAALLDVSPISDIIQVDSADTFKRPIYAGNAIATVQSSDKIKLITIRPTAFAAASTTGGSATIEPVDGNTETLSKWVSEEIVKSDRPELASAKIVVSGGRALKSAENFKLMYDLADKMGAAGIIG
jgi:electron transfer flavoprotein alpha subunit